MGLVKIVHEILTKASTKKVEGYEAWIVHWYARYGDYSSDTKPVSKVFLSEDDANLFVESLKLAQQVLQNTDDIHIKVEKI